MDWTRLQRITPGGTNLWHSFDFFVTDTTGGFKLGFAASVVPNSSSLEGILYYFSLNELGGGLFVSQIDVTPSGRGLINPSIISDGYLNSAGITYWYVTYTNYSASTPTANPVKAAYTPDWGATWTAVNTRTGQNDYDAMINYNSFTSSDTIYVIMSNNVTAASPNLRIFRRALSNFAGAGSWSQYNLTQTADVERYGQLVVNRQTNQMVAAYSKSTNIAYQYGMPGGTYFNSASPNILAPGNMPSLDAQESQGAYRISYNSASGSYDTIIYKATFDPSGGFLGHQVVNATNSASPSVASSIAGFRIGVGTFGGGVGFAGFGPTNIWYDASDIVPTSVSQNNTSIPNEYKLNQNYPNPFNPSTTINFSIPKSGLVKLVVYDVMGREVKTLINENMEPGNYDYVLDATTFGSGIYFYKIVSGSFFETKKMMVIK